MTSSRCKFNNARLSSTALSQIFTILQQIFPKGFSPQMASPVVIALSVVMLTDFTSKYDGAGVDCSLGKDHTLCKYSVSYMLFITLLRDSVLLDVVIYLATGKTDSHRMMDSG